MEDLTDFILDCIEVQRGDDLSRAKLEFKHCTPEEMNQQYGQSNQTRQEIINHYKAHEEKCDAARKVVSQSNISEIGI